MCAAGGVGGGGGGGDGPPSPHGSAPEIYFC